MIRIALIGEIGSGKTFVSKCFKYPLFNADDEVNKIYKNNKTCFYKLKRIFPNNIKNFPILKSEIKQILNKKNIKLLSKVIHPYVRLNLKKFLIKNRKSKYVILDIPLLIENKLYKKNDIIIFIKTSKKKIIERLKKRGSSDINTINILRSMQLNKKKKIKFSNYVINNNFGKEKILKQIKQIIND